MRTHFFTALVAALLAASGASPTLGLCVPSPSVACLIGDRFAVEVAWTDPPGVSSEANMVGLFDNTAYAWFTSSEEVEVVVKILDGRAVNGFFWVFATSLTDLEYTLTITDTATGAVKTYLNPAGELLIVADTGAFADSAPAVSPETSEAQGLGPDELLLLDGRFTVSVVWADPRIGSSGMGFPAALTGRSGYFWLFGPDSLDVTVKIVDGRAINGHFWFFYGPLTDIEYTVTVTDLVTGFAKTYFNPLFTLEAVADRMAIPELLIFTDGFESGNVSAWSTTVGVP